MELRLNEFRDVIQTFQIDSQELDILLKEIVVHSSPEIWLNYNQESSPKFIGLIDSVKGLTKTQQNLDICRFLLQSFLFILKRNSRWPIFSQFAGYAYFIMNQEIEFIAKDPSRAGEKSELSRQWYEIMTSPDLPIVPRNLILSRCNYSVQGTFDWLDKAYVDSYRTTSCSLKELTKCAGIPYGVVNARIEMYIACNVPGLYIGFKNLVRFDEREVVLPPGIRYTWQRDALDRIPSEIRNDKSFETIDGELRSKYKVAPEGEGERFYVLYRSYNATFIRDTDIDDRKFTDPETALRVQRLRQGIQKLNVILEKHKRSQAEASIRTQLAKTLARARKRIHDRAISNLVKEIEEEEERLWKSEEMNGQQTNASFAFEVKRKAIKNLDNKIQMEEDRIRQHQLSSASKEFPFAVRKALDSEARLRLSDNKLDRKTTAELFLKAEVLFEFLEEDISDPQIMDNFPDLRLVKDRFIKSPYARKYAELLRERFIETE
jgi:hypothetical protein